MSGPNGHAKRSTLNSVGYTKFPDRVVVTACKPNLLSVGYGHGNSKTPTTFKEVIVYQLLLRICEPLRIYSDQVSCPPLQVSSAVGRAAVHSVAPYGAAQW